MEAYQWREVNTNSTNDIEEFVKGIEKIIRMQLPRVNRKVECKHIKMDRNEFERLTEGEGKGKDKESKDKGNCGCKGEGSNAM